MVMADRVTGHVLVCAPRMGMIGIVDLMDVEYLAGMKRNMAASMGNCRHDNHANEHPDQNQYRGKTGPHGLLRSSAGRMRQRFPHTSQPNIGIGRVNAVL